MSKEALGEKKGKKDDWSEYRLFAVMKTGKDLTKERCEAIMSKNKHLQEARKRLLQT